MATLLSAIDFADLPGEDEGFTPLTDTELVELVLSDNAPGLVDVLDTDEPTVPTYNLTACLEALELIQITLSANGAAQRLKTSLQMWSMMCRLFSATLSSKLRSQFFSATEADTCNLHL
jgi:hypothetical protein